MLRKWSRNVEEMQRISERLKGARGNAKGMLEESQRISKIARDLKESQRIASECSRNAEEVQRISEGLKGARGNAKDMLEEPQRISKIARDLKESQKIASELKGSQRK